MGCRSTTRVRRRRSASHSSRAQILSEASSSARADLTSSAVSSSHSNVATIAAPQAIVFGGTGSAIRRPSCRPRRAIARWTAATPRLLRGRFQGARRRWEDGRRDDAATPTPQAEDPQTRPATPGSSRPVSDGAPSAGDRNPRSSASKRRSARSRPSPGKSCCSPPTALSPCSSDSHLRPSRSTAPPVPSNSGEPRDRRSRPADRGRACRGRAAREAG